jgi:hypothetical protein
MPLGCPPYLLNKTHQSMRAIFRAAAFAALLFPTACSQYFYTPGTQKIPDLRQKGDLRIQANLGLEAPSPGSEISASWATRPNFGWLATAQFAPERSYSIEYATRSEPTLGTGNYLEAGAGYFRHLENMYTDEPAGEDGVTTMAFGGAGIGNFRTSVFRPTGMNTANVRFSKVWVQPAAILRNRFFEVGLSLRLARLDFFRGDFSGNNLRFYETYDFLKKQRQFIVAEPAFFVQVGGPVVRFNIHGSASTAPAEISSNSNFGFGVQYFFGGPKPAKRLKIKPLPVPMPRFPVRVGGVCKMSGGEF